MTEKFTKKMLKAGLIIATLLLYPGAGPAEKGAVVCAAELTDTATNGNDSDSSEITFLYTAEDLLTIADNPSGNYVLMKDIDMNGVNWVPLPFSGVLDGNGHSLLNLKITTTGDTTADTYDGNMKVYDASFAGLFCTMKNAAVSDLTLLGLDISVDTPNPCFIGSISGYAENSSITGCTINGTLELRAYDRMFGVGGIIGYGCGLIENTSADVTLICVDTDAANRDEQFMGGVCAAGYPDINSCTIQIAGYDSDHGYVHNGGLVGMYMFYPRGTTYYGSMTNNRVTGKITFFEDNTNRRAYCKDFVGEIVNWDFLNSGNSSDFVRDERFEYNVDLMPHTCQTPVFTDTVTAPGCDTFGYTLHSCDLCGYTFYDSYTLKQHNISTWQVVKEATTEAPGLERGNCNLCEYTEEREIPRLTPPPETLQPSESDTSDTAALSENIQPKNGSWLQPLPILCVLIFLILFIGAVIALRRRR